MIIRLNTWNGNDALVLVNILDENGYHGVLTMNGTEESPYQVAFDTDDVIDECEGECIDCPQCNEDCEFWEDCGKVREEEKKEEPEYIYHPVDNPYENEDKIDVISAVKFLDELLENAKSHSRILNE